MTTKLLMKKLYLVALSIAAVLLLSRPAQAQPIGTNGINGLNSILTVSETAAATLLVPYFEVDLNNPAGMNTIFTIDNTGGIQCFPYMGTLPCHGGSGSTAVLAHVTIWSDLSVPVFNFNVYLTGFDVERVDMRRLLMGLLPQTASAGQDPTDTISPKGMFSQDINFSSCNLAGNMPTLTAMGGLPPAALTGAQLDNLVRSLTGNPSPERGGNCAGVNHGDNVARGYVTIDTVNKCTQRFPSDAGYFGSGGDATDQLQLTGEVYYVDPNHAIAYGGNLVHIHADPTDPATSTPGRYTFYGRYDGWSAVDHRQPLSTAFAARFLGGVPVLGHHIPEAPPHSFHAGSTSLIVWRDSKVDQGYFTCPVTPHVNPPWYTLSQEGAILAFDEQEHPQGLPNPIPFPAETQKVRIGGAALPVSFPSGWLFMDLNATVFASGGNPPYDPGAAQAWVQVLEQDVHQTQNVMHNAQQLDTATGSAHFLP